MHLNIFTIVQNGMPFIDQHYETFAKLKIPWKWHIVHGPAANVGCTRWCKPQPQKLSKDGTSEVVYRLGKLPNVILDESHWWRGGKREMCNRALSRFQHGGILMQIDVDEFYTPYQLHSVVLLFELNKKAMRAYFKCNYYFGPDIQVIPSTDRNNSWLRAWWFRPGMCFQSHEPPVLCNNAGPGISAEDSERAGVVFEHKAYVTEAQVRYKEEFYGYTGAVNGWRNLQANTKWPVEVRQFLPFAPVGVMVDRMNDKALQRDGAQGTYE